MNPSPVAASAVNSADVRDAFGRFPQSVVLIGAEIDGAPEGLVASTFTVGVSLDPPLATFAVQHTSATWPVLRERAPQLGVSLIGAAHGPVVRQLAGKDRPARFTNVQHSVDAHGALFLHQTPVSFSTRIFNEFTAGDHQVVVLEILGLHHDDDAEPLVFHQSCLKSLQTP